MSRVFLILVLAFQWGCKSPSTPPDDDSLKPAIESETKFEEASDDPINDDQKNAGGPESAQVSDPEPGSIEEPVPAVEPQRSDFADGQPTVQGSLDPNVVRRVVRMHRGQVRACYEAELKKNPSLQGSVTFLFVVSSTGAVGSAKAIDSTLNNENLERCVTNHILRWEFPEPKGGGIAIVRYPYKFSLDARQ